MRVLYPTKHPFCTTAIPLVIGVSFTTTPGSDVTVTITGDSITTASDTLTPAECLAGVAIPVYASTSNAGKLPCTLTISATGGETSSTTIQAYISEGTEEVNRKWTPYMYLTDGIANWRREYPSFTLAEAEAKRLHLIDGIFGASYPSGAPSSIANGVTNNSNGVTFNVASPIRRSMTFTETDVDGYTWTKIGYWATNASASSTLVISFSGHGEIGHQSFYDAVYAAGHDFASCSMPILADTTNPTISGTFGGHNSYLTGGLDRAGYDARRLFFFDKIRTIDYILSQKSYTKVILCGVSGGGYTAAQLSAFYTGIDKVFIQRGTSANGLFESELHYEEGPDTSSNYLNEGNCGPRVAAKVRTHPRLHWPAMAIANGASEVHNMTHPNDTVGNFNMWKPQIYGADLATICASLGGTFEQFFNINPSETTHGWQPTDITYVINNI